MNPLTVRPDRLERLRSACLGLPGAAEKIAWGDPTWRMRDKIFAMQKGNYEGGRPSLWLKAPEGAQMALVQAQPERFFVPPYVGNKGWIGVYLDTRSIDWPFIESLIEESYRLIAPRKLAAAADAERPTTVERTRAKRSSARGKGTAVAARKQTNGKAAAARIGKQSSPGRTSQPGRTRQPGRTSSPGRTSQKARMTKKKVSALTRPRHPMPAFVKKALSEHGLTAAYRARPDYQQNDYIGWISAAKQESTQQKRLDQMLDELKGGNRYMKMKWGGGSPARAFRASRVSASCETKGSTRPSAPSSPASW